MKEITKEQINEIVSNVIVDISENMTTMLINNIKTCQQSIREINMPEIEQYSLFLASMNTTLQMSATMIKAVLCELLCND